MTYQITVLAWRFWVGVGLLGLCAFWLWFDLLMRFYSVERELLENMKESVPEKHVFGSWGGPKYPTF